MELLGEFSKKFILCPSRPTITSYTHWNRLMTDDKLRYLIEHAEDLVPVLYDHARKLAARKYGWRDGKTLPLGKTPEDIVTEAYVKYINGERNFDPEKDFMLQLKGSIRSLMWALCDKSSTKNELLAQTEEQASAVIEFGSNDATPAEILESADFAKAVCNRVKSHEKITANIELCDLLAAYELGITDVAGQLEMLKKEAGKADQIHQLRYQLREIYRDAINKTNSE